MNHSIWRGEVLLTPLIPSRSGKLFDIHNGCSSSTYYLHLMYNTSLVQPVQANLSVTRSPCEQTPRIYGLPKVRKPDVPPCLIISFITSLTYQLSVISRLFSAHLFKRHLQLLGTQRTLQISSPHNNLR